MSVHNFEGVAKDLPGSRYIPVQAQGMGNAFLPLATDNPGALFYQPSALAKKKVNTADIINLQLESNNDFFNSSSFQYPSASSLNGLVTEKNSGKVPYIGGQLAMGFGYGGFSVGGLYKQNTRATRQEDEVYYKTLYQVIPAAGYGVRLADGVIRMGYSVQWVHEKSAERRVDYSDNINFSDNLDQGSGLSHNFGFTMTLPNRFLPSFDVTVRNINKTSFAPFSLVPVAGSSSGTTPETNPMSIDASVSIQPKIHQNSKAFLVVQLNDANNRSNTPIMRRASVGTQIDLGSTFRIRAGVSEGYPSLGFGLDRPMGNFDVSWYSIERGSGFRDDRDIRLALQLRIRIY